MYKIDHDTFKQLWDEHFRPLVYLCRKHKVWRQAEDIVSDKFVKLWEMRDGFDDPVKIKGFLYISVMNAVKNELKFGGKTVGFDYSADIEQEAQLQEIEVGVIAAIHKEIENLPTKCRTVFKMRVFDRKGYFEIAAQLNMAYSTVDSHYQRARKLLRKRIRYEF